MKDVLPTDFKTNSVSERAQNKKGEEVSENVNKTKTKRKKSSLFP